MIRGAVLFTGDHSKQDLRYTLKPIYSSSFRYNIWSYLLWSPVIVRPVLGKKTPPGLAWIILVRLLRTAVPFMKGDIKLDWSGLSPKRDCGAERVTTRCRTK